MTEPLPSQSSVAVLWAMSERYKTPNVVVAYSESLADALREAFDERIAEAKQWFLDFGDESDGPWSFWVTYEAIPTPAQVLPPVDTDGPDGPPIGPACRSCGGNDGYGPPPHHAPDCYFASTEDAGA